MSARFDLSDQQPSEFGAMSGKGMWEILRNYLRNPVDVDGTAQLLEEACNRSSRR
jgi:alpha-glucoside transport system substrate-binding protein